LAPSLSQRIRGQPLALLQRSPGGELVRARAHEQLDQLAPLPAVFLVDPAEALPAIKTPQHSEGDLRGLADPLTSLLVEEFAALSVPLVELAEASTRLVCRRDQ